MKNAAGYSFAADGGQLFCHHCSNRVYSSFLGEQGIECFSGNGSRVSSATSSAGSRPGTGAADSNEVKKEMLILSEAKSILREGSSSNKSSPTKETSPSSPSQPSTATISPTNGQQRKSLVIESEPPEKDTRLEDIVADLPATVLSRPGSPDVWNFDEKEMSLKATPPRPTSATLCSPPVPRKVPISVDHHLRK